MSDTKVSALTAASTPLDEGWLIALAKGTPDNLDRRATLASVRGEAGFGLRRNAGVWSVYTPFGDPQVAVFFDDFLGSSTSFFAYNSGGAFAILTGDALNIVGVAGVGTGTSTTGRGGFIWPSTNPAATSALYFGAGRWVFETRVRLSALSDGTNTYSARTGFTRDPASETPLDGAFFSYNPAAHGNGNWHCVSRNNNSNRVVDTGVAASASAWQVLRIEVPADASEILSYIDGTLEDTNTTNIPSGSSRRFGYGCAILKSAGSTGRDIYVDYVLLKCEFASGRPA